MTHRVLTAAVLAVWVVVLVAAAANLQAQVPPPVPEEEKEKTTKPAEEGKRQALPEERDEDKPPPPPPPPVLLLTSDTDCTVTIDGVEKATLVKDIPSKIRVREGERLIQAFPLGIDGPSWTGTVDVPPTGQVVEVIELAEIVAEWLEAKRVEEVEGRFAVGTDTVKDNETGHIWAKKPVNEMKWGEASSYCGGSMLGGERGWSLPSIQELSTLFWEDNPEPMHEALDGQVTSSLLGLKKRRGPMTVLPVMVYHPFEGNPRMSRLWTSEEKVTCSFLEQFNCQSGVKKGDALCIRSSE